MSQRISIATSLIIDSIQTRAETNADTVVEYAEAMAAGATFPPVTVFEVSSGDYVLADGLHRLAAVKRNGGKSIEVEVHPGSRADALVHALKANVTNGLRRTNADKRRCVEIALESFKGYPARQIADMCGVSHMMVADVMKDVEDSSTSPAKVKDRLGRMQPAKKAKKHASDPAPTTAKISQSAFPAEPGAQVEAGDKYADIKAGQAESALKQAEPQPEPTRKPDELDDDEKELISRLIRLYNSVSPKIQRTFLNWIQTTATPA